MKATPSAILLAFVLLGCTPFEPEVVRAVEVPFPAAFGASTEWTEFGIGPLPGNPDRFASIDALVAQLDGFLRAGIRRPGPESGVTIAVPEGADAATEVHVFATVVGGAGENSAGTQMRLVLRRAADGGWWLDPTGEWKLYCVESLRPGAHIC